MEASIRTFGLTKYYGGRRGIEDLELVVRPGEIFGFLGPNGAGKTTTIRLLLDLLRPTRGRAEVLGLDVRTRSLEVRQRIGYIAGEVAFFESMTGADLLHLLARIHRDGARADEVARRLELEDDLDRPIRTYSRGMKQKLAIVQAMAHDPDLLILDEPTVGLDPLMQRQFNNLMVAEKERGKTVFLSSHRLAEVERICDRVGIVRDGLLVGVEDVEELKRRRVRRLELVLEREVRAEDLAIGGAEVISVQGRSAELAVSGDLRGLLAHLATLPVQDFVFPEATLEETFMDFYAGEAGHEPGPVP